MAYAHTQYEQDQLDAFLEGPERLHPLVYPFTRDENGDARCAFTGVALSEEQAEELDGAYNDALAMREEEDEEPIEDEWRDY